MSVETDNPQEIPISLPFDMKLVALIKQHIKDDPIKLGEIVSSLVWHTCQTSQILLKDKKLARRRLSGWILESFEKLDKKQEDN